MADTNFYPGDAASVWYRDSDVPGPTAVILGGIHGNERAGIETVKRMASGEFDIPLERGRLIIALGNIAAIDADVRFMDTNLNREFKEPTAERLEANEQTPSREFARAQQLMPVLDEAHAALDLHGFRQKDGVPFIITEERGFGVARKIGAPFISSGWSTIEAGGTDGYMEEQEKVGLCYELGQLQDLKNGIPAAERGVLEFLDYMQLIEITRERPATPAGDPTFVHATDAVLAKPGFAWGPNHPYKSWQALQPRELIAHNGPGTPIHADQEQVIIFPSDDKTPKPGDEMFNVGNIIDPKV